MIKNGYNFLIIHRLLIRKGRILILIENEVKKEKSFRDMMIEAGALFHEDRASMFHPFRRYCERKKLDFEQEVTGWMYMHHDVNGIYYYKNACTRVYFTLTEKGIPTESLFYQFVQVLRKTIKLFDS